MTDTVLGISVVDDQIASVVRDGDGRVVASNLVDMPDSATSSQVESAIEELVTSVPMDFQHIGLAVADDSLREHLNSAFAPTAGTPDWHSKIGVTDFPTALAEVARAQATRPGVVAVYPELWEQVPVAVRRDWERRLVPLVVALPADTGVAAPSRRHAVRELLARSVGYEITFSGGS